MAESNRIFGRMKRPRLSQLVADELEEAIISGIFELGSRLPSEEELAGQFEVSRNVVREALKILAERGLSESVSGSGTFVSVPDASAAVSALARYMRMTGAGSSARSLIEARRILEPANARLAATRASEQDLVDLGACIARMRQSADSIDDYAEADLEFHTALAQATHNEYLRILVEALGGQLRHEFVAAYLATQVGGIDEHVGLYEAIRLGDAEHAHEMMMTHLDNVEAIMAEAVSATHGDEARTDE